MLRSCHFLWISPKTDASKASGSSTIAKESNADASVRTPNNLGGPLWLQLVMRFPKCENCMRIPELLTASPQLNSPALSL
jgi:hypothetical protein